MPYKLIFKHKKQSDKELHIIKYNTKESCCSVFDADISYLKFLNDEIKLNKRLKNFKTVALIKNALRHKWIYEGRFFYDE